MRPVSEKPFVWIDTETSGLDPLVNEVIEIAIVRMNCDGTETILSSKVRMEHPENAHPRALEVNGYSAEAWEGAPSQADLFQIIHDRGLLQDCILAGQNVGFDAAFINATFKRLGIDARVDYHLYDTVTLALRDLKPWLRSVSLVPVCVALGIPTEGAHTALADCRMAQAVDHILTTATPAQRAEWPHIVPARLAAYEAKRKG